MIISSQDVADIPSGSSKRVAAAIAYKLVDCSNSRMDEFLSPYTRVSNQRRYRIGSLTVGHWKESPVFVHDAGVRPREYYEWVYKAQLRPKCQSVLIGVAINAYGAAGFEVPRSTESPGKFWRMHREHNYDQKSYVTGASGLGSYIPGYCSMMNCGVTSMICGGFLPIFALSDRNTAMRMGAWFSGTNMTDEEVSLAKLLYDIVGAIDAGKTYQIKLVDQPQCDNYGRL